MKIKESQLRKIIRENLTIALSENAKIGDYITNKEEGDKFREWVNDNHEDYAKEKNLDRSGGYKNLYFKKAWAAFGKEYLAYKEKNKLDKNTVDYLGKMKPSPQNGLDFNHTKIRLGNKKANNIVFAVSDDGSVYARVGGSGEKYKKLNESRKVNINELKAFDSNIDVKYFFKNVFPSVENKIKKDSPRSFSSIQKNIAVEKEKRSKLYHKAIEKHSGLSRGPGKDDRHDNNADVIASIGTTCYALADGVIEEVSYSGDRYNELYKKVSVKEAKKEYPGFDYSWKKLRAGASTWIPHVKSKENHKKIGKRSRKEVGEMWDKAMDPATPAGSMTQDWFKKNYPYKERSLSPWSSSGAEGNQIIIRFDEPIDLNGFKVRRATYTHLDGSVEFSKKGKVTKGQELGKVSLNGQITGPHLHFVLLDVRGKKPTSPEPYLMALDGPGGESTLG